MAGTGYNIPVSASNATTPTNTNQSPTTIIFGNGYAPSDLSNQVTPTSTAVSSAANGPSAASVGASGAGAGVTTPNYALWVGIGAAVLSGIGLIIIIARKP